MTKLSRTLSLALIASTLSFAGTASAKIATGSTVSNMTVTDSNGMTHNLSDYKGKKVILEWTNDGCPYVQKHYETGNMQAIQKEATADSDTVWLSVISSAPGKQGHVSGAEANNLTVTRDAAPSAVVLDPEGTMGKAFNAKTTPHMYIIDADQTLVYQGAIDDNRSAKHSTVATAKNYVKAALADMEAGRPIAESDTAPYGCSVKYKS
ncbi:peroxiredoxin [Litorimonas taeanensis]|uniref:Peroxiredoxin n=1 Tax=Litorimonas taeanensis TaxID=568099 RepID=A0A420WLC4_9PROT|nr:redoxin family protein [Litorimonas taeanensis]RKQ71828.1 peroxiredoxin [Litorimonas taeanensis]